MTDDELRAEWGALAPPPDFADRVLAATHPRRPRWPWALSAAAAAAAVLLAWGLAARWPTAGAIVANSQTTATLGHRAVAVAEPGAELSWAVGWQTTEIDQPAGRVFYRVAPGGPFTIRTPGGAIRATSACFTVEVSPMGRDAKWKQPILAGLVGATLSAAALVTVYEGQVEISQAGASVEVGPGQRAGAADGVAPRALDPADEAPATPAGAALEQENARLRAEVAALESAVARKRDGATDPREVERLRTAVADLERALEQEQAARAQEEGTARGIPDDLPAAYRGPAMRAAFEQILAEVGMDAEVVDVDCDEFPCIVYGATRHAGKEAMDAEMNAMQAALQARYSRDDHDVHNSVWGSFSPTADRQENTFGIAIYPKAFAGDRDDLKKRMRYRQTAYMDAYLARKGQK